MTYIIRLSTILIFFISCTTTRAQEVWDWNKCLQYALDNNIQIRQDALNISLAELQTQQDRLGLTPYAQATSAYTYALGRTVDMSTYEYVTKPVSTGNLQVSVTQPIFEGLKNINTLKKSKLDLKASRLDNETLKQNIQLQVMNAYLNILNAQEQVQQAKEQLDISTTQRSHNQKLIDAGSLAEKAIADNDAQVASDEYNVAQLNQQLQLAYLALKAVLQLDFNRDIVIAQPPLTHKIKVEDLSPADKIYQEALKHRPEIASALTKKESAQLGLKIAKAAYMPTLSLFSGVGTNLSDQITETVGTTTQETPIGYVKNTGDAVYTLIPQPELAPMRFGKQIINNISYAFGLNLTIPIYNRRAGYFSKKRADISLLQAEINEQDISNKLFQNIQEAYLKAITSEQNFNAAQKSLTAAQKSLDYAQERYNFGAISQLEFNLAQNNLLMSKSRLTQAKYDYLFNVKVLDFYSGKPIDF